MNQIKLNESLKSSIKAASLVNAFTMPCPVCQRNRANHQTMVLHQNGMIYNFSSGKPIMQCNVHGIQEVFCGMPHLNKWLLKQSMEV